MCFCVYKKNLGKTFIKKIIAKIRKKNEQKIILKKRYYWKFFSKKIKHFFKCKFFIQTSYSAFLISKKYTELLLLSQQLKVLR